VIDPIPVTIEYSGQKLQGFILKINPTGFLVELDKIPYRVGAILKVEFHVPETNEVVIEEVRAIKSYDKFFRTAPKAKLNEGESGPQPKKLAELHFLKIKESTRQAVMKLLMSLQVDSMKKSK
jgi:hypothetical protein